MLSFKRYPTTVAVALTLAAPLMTALPARAAELEEVIVTAQKREQSLQDVSVAVTAVSADDLLRSNIKSIEDLQTRVPGVTFGNDFSFAKLFIRGVGLNSSFAGIDPSVALHVDGAVVAQASAQFASLFDLERVEALRGPQGTLYGRNATGGSINLITAKPTQHFSGYTNLSIGGSDLSYGLDSALSGPLTDAMLGRVAVHYQHHDGYGIHTGSGKDIDDLNVIATRAHLQFKFSDNVDLLLSGEYAKEDDHSKSVHFIAPMFPVPPQPSLRALGLPNVLANSRNVGGDFRPSFESETWSTTATLTWQLSDAVALKSLTNYREFDDQLVQDFDVSDTVNGGFPPAPTSTMQLQAIGDEQFSEELQFIYEGDKLRGIAAAYYLQESIDSLVLLGRDPVRFPERSRVVVPATLDVDAWAVFANFTYAINDLFSVKAGARYSAEERTVENRFGVASPVDPAAVFDPVRRASRDYSDFSPEVGVELRPSSDMMLYATYSEGFKSGTANLGERVPNLVNPETIENFEAGIKSRWLRDTLLLNVAAFKYKVEDAQYDRTYAITAPPFYAARLENAATTDGRGVELESSWLATDRFRLSLSGTYYHIRFDRFLSQNPINPALFGPAGSSLPPEDLAGNSPRNTPDWTAELSATYKWPLTSGASLALTAAAAARDKQYYTEFNDDITGQDDYTLYDANLLYTTPGGKLTLNLWGKNLTDEMIVSGIYVTSTARTITGTYLPPRTYGATVGYKF
ncbi:TonB-dependent receptor [Steroidobacter sp. S1-65]|uniref:TonB-dependent receptor n=1 Tax=Steroidobacter gossypii TaxID=2805490 RepID=A0ABS1WYJ5_9GAMM|nr:TonB-dependent receptor [Steroidobacter gossypii]MBM0106049.1 TonB-dependent receptor [Steroidobacter gossypii]